MLAEGLSHIGLVRRKNEDAFVIDTVNGVLAVADGMGGHQAGELASQLAITELLKFIRQHNYPDVPGMLLHAFQQANRAVFEQARQQAVLAGMGTTMTAVLVRAGMAHIAHVGDSRAYLFRQGEVTCLTTDHSLVAELVTQGSLTPDEALIHPKRNMLTRAVGVDGHVDVEMMTVSLSPGDYLLLCTDGLSSEVTALEMAKLVYTADSMSGALQSLVNLALQRGGRDNITALLARI